MQKILQNTSWEQAGDPDHQKGIYRSTQNSVRQARKGKRGGRVSRTEPAPELRRNRSRGQIPYRDNCLGQRRSIRDCWRAQQLLCDSLSGVRNTQTILAAALCTLGRDPSPPECEAAGSWHIRMGKQSQGEVCYWLLGDGLRRCEGEDHGGECLWKKARQSWRWGATAESCAGGGGITVAFLSPPALAADQ